MKVHHLNCGTLRPHGSLGGRISPPRMVCHVLLVERPDGLVLVDTGFGTADLESPARLGRPFVAAMRPSLALDETALRQVIALGFKPGDVREVVLTHMDLDHAGGLADFASARVHVDAEELAAAKSPKPSERARYRSVQWSHSPRFVEHTAEGDGWFGFASVRAVADDVLLVPLRGHSRGHCGVAVRRPDGGWLLHAGDSYFWHGEVDRPATYRRGLTLFQKAMSVDERARLANQERLQELRAGHPEVTVFSAHDVVDFEGLAR